MLYSVVARFGGSVRQRCHVQITTPKVYSYRPKKLVADESCDSAQKFVTNSTKQNFVFFGWVKLYLVLAGLDALCEPPFKVKVDC
jgi:hypothetical protein